MSSNLVVVRDVVDGLDMGVFGDGRPFATERPSLRWLRSRSALKVRSSPA